MSNSVTLVYPKFRYPCGDPPLGLLYVAAQVRDSIPDCALSFIDGNLHPTLGYVRKRLHSEKPSVVGIYADSHMMANALAVAVQAKRAGAKVILGGPHPTIDPYGCLTHAAVDAVCVGEGEHSLPEYITCISESRLPAGILGIGYKREGRIIINPPRPPIRDLRSIPMPARDLIDMEAYIKRWYHFSHHDGMRGTSVLASRGCAFSCSYCQPTLDRLFGKGVRYRPAKDVVDELAMLLERYRINAFHLQDDTATMGLWILGFCEELKDRGLSLAWSCNSRVDTLDDAKLAAMKSAGCVEVRLGIESVNERMLNEVYQKNSSLTKAAQAINLLKRHNLVAFGYFMLGGPTETLEEVKETVDFAVRSQLDIATFSITVPLPGTKLHERFGSPTTDFRHYNYYTATPANRSTVALGTLNRLKKEAYLRFYLHPSRLRSTANELLHPGKAWLKLKRF